MTFEMQLFPLQLLSSFKMCVCMHVCVCLQFRPLSATLAAFTLKNNGERRNFSTPALWLLMQTGVCVCVCVCVCVHLCTHG